MGGCVSNHQKSSPMKVPVLFGSNDDNIIKPKWSPSKSTPAFRDFGSKEETFFDSQAWLDSDCDDDFMSVNGEFTPSRGNTPVHHKFTAGNNKPPVAVAVAVTVSQYQPSPNGPEKMRLSDLFKDSSRGNYDSENEEDDQAVKKGMNPNVESPLVHGGNVLRSKRERFGSCFPSLLSRSSSSTNGRKMMSPGLGLNPSPSPNPIVA